MSYVYLKIPDMESFRDFLISHRVHEYAIVQRRTGIKGFVQCFMRLTAKLEDRREVAVCDIPFWEGMEYDLDNEEKLTLLNQKKDEVAKEIENTMSSGTVDEELPEGESPAKVPYQMHSIDGEYATTLESR
jgi:hypothetical protein